MNNPQLLTHSTHPAGGTDLQEQVCVELRNWLGYDVDLWDAVKHQRVIANANVAQAVFESSGVLEDLFRVGQVDFVAEADAVLIAAFPLSYIAEHRWVATFPVLARPLEPSDDRAAIAELLGIDPTEVEAWARSHSICSPEIVSRLAMSMLMNKETELHNVELSSQLEATCDRLASTFEELTLFHRLTQNLSVSSSDKELGLQGIEWVLEYLPAAGCGLYLLPRGDAETATYDTRREPELLKVGEFAISSKDLETIIGDADLAYGCAPHLLTAEEHEVVSGLEDVREVLLATVCDRTHIFGHLIFINKFDAPAFEAKDSNMIASVAAILGTHCGNHELYRQQSEFLANVVRALTSAIDAKDQYTCGHSDRVARIAVRICRELNCSTDELHTIYMGGLLHDVGKIGINDSVLQKPDSLTPEEYEHIKQHPQLGCNILTDIQQFDDVIPIVLHHHEQWNGNGYPHGLEGADIPFLARVTAVADAFDAITSSRCYRKGMSIERVKEILRDGAGTQWDPAVIDAFFRAEEDVLEIIQNEREGLSLDVKSWL